MTLADGVVDDLGRPVARLAGAQHAETVRTAEVIRARAEEWLHAGGAERVWTAPIGNRAQRRAAPGRHLPHGRRPRGTSVTDPWGRVHGHDNLWVMDGSVHVTNGPVNPVLTILALAFRSAGLLARSSGGREYAIGHGSAARATPPICSAIGRTWRIARPSS